MALKTANIFLVQALTGHKTLQMVERYVNVKAADAVKVLHAPDAPAPQPAEDSKNAGMKEAGVVLSPEQVALIANAVVQATSSAAATKVTVDGAAPYSPTIDQPQPSPGESGGDVIDFHEARQRRAGGR